MKKIICLYGGPCAGKTTTMAFLFGILKQNGQTGEMNPEYIKGWVWEERKVRPGDQTYFFAKMAKKERNLMEAGVDFIVTDSPLILTHFYGLKYDKFEQLSNASLMMLKNHHEVCKAYGYKVEHYILTRGDHYDPKGRLQTADEARQYDIEIKKMLDEKNIKYKMISGVDCLDMAQAIVIDLVTKANAA